MGSSALHTSFFNCNVSYTYVSRTEFKFQSYILLPRKRIEYDGYQRNQMVRIFSLNNEFSTSSVQSAAQNGRPRGEMTTETKEKKKRGRKKKIVESETLNSMQVGNEEKAKLQLGVETIAPKKRGRRKKVQESETIGSKNETRQDSLRGIEDTKIEKTIEPDMASVPKKRGRKKKLIVEKEKQAEETTMISVPKKRGRKKKVIEPEFKVEEPDFSKGEGINGRERDEKYMVESDSEIDSGDEFAEANYESYKYPWPPLVCCFGDAQKMFVPLSVKHPAPEYQEEDGFMLCNNGDLLRSRGGSTFNIAIKIAQLGGKVAFMGKVGNDILGRKMVIKLNRHNVQTRGVIIDKMSSTSISKFNFSSKKGKIGIQCSEPCAQEAFLSSDINWELLKETRMLYFNTMPLLSSSMNVTLAAAIQFTKEQGGIRFYDVKLPLPLWRSHSETWKVIRQTWQNSNVIKISKQELEFLLGHAYGYRKEWMDQNARPNEDMSELQFRYYEFLKNKLLSIWHEDIKLLVLNDGKGLLYFTQKYLGIIEGYELGAFSYDRSATNDAFVAGLIRSVAVQPELLESESYLEWIIRRAARAALAEENFKLDI